MTIVYHTANDLPVGQRQSDGYVDATAMCKSRGKRLDKYFSADATTPFLQALQAKLTREGGFKGELIETRKGRGGGTWVHPHVAIHLGMWLDPEFAVEVIGWIEHWMSTGDNPVKRSPQPQPEPTISAPAALPPAPGWSPHDWVSLPLVDQRYFSETPEQESRRRTADWADINRYLDSVQR